MSKTPETEVSRSIAVGAAEKGEVKPVEVDKADELRIADLREDGSVILELPDGRMFPATVKDGIGVKRRNKVSITSDGDEDGVPQNAVVTKVL